jgi:putative membrane protein
MDSDEERPTPTGQLAPPSVRDHLANERTLLSWVRTAIAVIALGFVVDRLALGTESQGLAGFAGIALVGVGALVALIGAYSYLDARRELATGSYRPKVGLHLAIVGLVLVAAMVIALYLVLSP